VISTCNKYAKTNPGGAKCSVFADRIGVSLAQQLTNWGRAKIEEVVEKGSDEEAAKIIKSKRNPLRRLKRMLWLLKSQDVPAYGYLANETCEVVQAVQYCEWIHQASFKVLCW
jgi:hypothetical protein